MFDIGGTELLLIAVVTLLVIGPKDLPRVLRVVGQYTAKARSMTRHLRSGFDEMLRQAELEEMEKKWADYNRSIMEQAPSVPDVSPSASVSAAVTPFSPAGEEQPAAEDGSPETISGEIPPPDAKPAEAADTPPADAPPSGDGPEAP